MATSIPPMAITCKPPKLRRGFDVLNSGISKTKIILLVYCGAVPPDRAFFATEGKSRWHKTLKTTAEGKPHNLV